MDRSKWEYKKLKDICVSIDDGDWIESQDQSSEGIRLIQTGNIGVGEYLDKSDKSKYISEETFSRLKCKEIFGGDCLISRLPDPIGRACILPMMSDRMITAVDCSIVRFKENVVPGYFVHYTKSRKYNSDISKFATGATRKRISRKNLEGIVIPMPSSELQKQIVAELDCLNEMIAIKQEQLKEFDKLALSIFYDMFGDIESNSKGFDKSHLGKICQLKAGKAIKAEELHEDSEGLYPCFGGNGIRGFIDRFSHEGLFPIIGRQGALCGNINIAKGKFYATEHAVVVTPLIEMNRTWLAFVLQSMHLEKYAHGVAQPGLSVKDLNPIDMITPPLALQQRFAEKISAIEAQKELVKQSIAETQALLDYTMDKYFGYD